MPVLDAVCRWYQRRFDHGHPEEAKLVHLHRADPGGEYLRAYFDHEYDKGRAVVERFAALAPGWDWGRSLDFGCGAGGLTYRIREKSRATVGIDLDAGKIAFGAAQAARLGMTGVELIRYDGGAVPLPDRSFDTVVCVDVVEHLPTPTRFLAEFRRLLVPGGMLFLSFGPPWGHAHGKHMWATLPGWWTHLLFPRRVVMRVSGFPEATTWEDLGMHKLTIGKFDRAMRASGFAELFRENKIKRAVAPLRRLPGLRELFISEVVAVYRNPG